MSCVSPTLIYKNGSVMSVPCRHCANCISQRVQDTAFLAQKELYDCYMSGLGATFVTLTYSDDNIPYSSKGYRTLVKSDFIKFMKRLRINAVRDGYNYKFKHISCGEYGDKFGRPHYHSVLIGLSDVLARKYIDMSWSKSQFGLVDVQALKSSSGVNYSLKYLSKSNPYGAVKRIYDFCCCQPPFVLHSVGIGRNWLERNLHNIVDSGFTYNLRGKTVLYPKSVRNYVRARLGVDPSPYVAKYLAGINTGGMSLDDFQAQQSYYVELMNYKSSIDRLKACALPAYMRKPLNLRDCNDFDYKSLITSCI